MKTEQRQMFTCAVNGCTTNSKNDPFTEFFPFPLDPTVSQKWITVCGLENQEINTEEAHVCVTHFEETAFITRVEVQNKLSFLTRVLCDNAIPTLNISKKDNLIFTEEINLTEKNYSKFVKLDDVVQQNNIWKEKIKELQNDVEPLRLLQQKQKREINKLKKYDYLLKNSTLTPTEKKLLSKILTEKQIKVLCEKRRPVWTHRDMIIAYTIRNLSNKRFYDYLSSKFYPLPATSTVRRWMYIQRSRSNNVKTEVIDIDSSE